MQWHQLSINDIRVVLRLVCVFWTKCWRNEDTNYQSSLHVNNQNFVTARTDPAAFHASSRYGKNSKSMAHVYGSSTSLLTVSCNIFSNTAKAKQLFTWAIIWVYSAFFLQPRNGEGRVKNYVWWLDEVVQLSDNRKIYEDSKNTLWRLIRK
jgi:hypothetical protein